MDELKTLLGTFTGKIISAILIALFLSLGTFAYKGLMADNTAAVANNTSSIDQNKKDIKSLTSVVSGNTDRITNVEQEYRNKVDKILGAISDIRADISYMKGASDARKKLNEK